jgi:molybdopterin-guanine dinucleotide biosynthesis protein A
MNIFKDKPKITGVVLSGGLSRRMNGQEKAFLKLKGKAMICYTLEKLAPQVSTLVINANQHTEQYRQYGYPVIKDEFGSFDGPLAGIYTALSYTTDPYLMVVPCDSPLISDDLIQRLYNAVCNNKSQLAVAHDGNRLQPVFALISTQLKSSLKSYLENGQRKLDNWYIKSGATIVDFSDTKEMFLNINTAEDLAALEKKL